MRQRTAVNVNEYQERIPNQSGQQLLGFNDIYSRQPQPVSSGLNQQRRKKGLSIGMIKNIDDIDEEAENSSNTEVDMTKPSSMSKDK